MVNDFKVITLCGSTRFKDAFLEAQKRLTLEGNIVVSVGLFGHSGDEEVWKPGIKDMLDRMHLNKIDMADEIFVINVGGYIGESTCREIEYALSQGKVVKYLERQDDIICDITRAPMTSCNEEQWESIEEKNRQLENELFHAKNAIKFLKKEIERYYPNYIDEYMQEHNTDYHLYKLLSSEFDPSFGFSKRTQNLLSLNNIVTIGDLVKLRESDVKHISGLGGKSFNELSEFIDSLNLHFGYDVDAVYEMYHLYFIELREQIRTVINVLKTDIVETDLIHRDYYDQLKSIINISTIGDVASLHKKGLEYFIYSDNYINDIESFLNGYGLHLGYNVEEIFEEYEYMKQHGYYQV